MVAETDGYDALIQSGGFDADIAVLFNFMDMSGEGSDLEKAPPAHRARAERVPRKFPVVEIPLCAKTGGDQLLRGRIISNRHFRLATLHSEVTARLKHPDVPADRRHLVVCEGSYAPWTHIVNHLHENATWVLCLDPAVDERLIAHDHRHEAAAAKRNIIGFASGVGLHGELNFTVSTERAGLGDLKRKLQERLNVLFGPWDAKRREAAAELFVEEARGLSGLSLVQATGSRDQQVRNLVGFGLVRRCGPEPETGGGLFLCDELVVLDTFYHWFDNMEDQDDRYPDLLRVEAAVDADDRVRVRATLLECKVSNNVLRHLETARSQIENGLHHLMARFRPRRSDRAMRFDQRFWWSQLQRLIANKSVVKNADRSRATAALEALGNGAFPIAWRAAALTVWTDGGGDAFSIDQTWPFPLPHDADPGGPCELTIPVISCGGGLIHRLCAGEKLFLPLDPDAWCTLTAGEDGPAEDLGRAAAEPASTVSAPERTETPSLDTIVAPQEAPSAAADDKSPTDADSPSAETAAPDAAGTPYPSAEESGESSARGQVSEDAPDAETPALPSVSPESEPAIAPSPAAVSPSPDSDPASQPDNPPSEIAPPAADSPDPANRLRARRVFLGQNEMGTDIFWEYGHPELTNRHLLIFGKSGVGKTYAIQTLLFELSRSGQNAVIVDYTDGFLSEHIEPPFRDACKPRSHFVIQQPLPVNPFRRQRSLLNGMEYREKPFIVAGRVTSVINSVYSSLGEQQQALLTKTIQNGIREMGDGFDFPTLLDRLEGGDKPGQNLANKLTPLVNMELFASGAENAWDDFFRNEENRVNILQLSKIPKDLQRIATEFILWDLYDYATSSGNKNNPLPIVLDEIQNLDHRLDAPLGKYLTEGRKFGISLVLATQTLSNLKSDERDRLFQASHKLFFRPAETEVKEYARILEQSSAQKADTWIARLNKLNKGECYSLGPSMKEGGGKLENRAEKIKVAAFGERGVG